MRKLGLACALSCASFAALVVPLDAVWADEPATITSSWKQIKATPAVLTAQRAGSVEASDLAARATRASEQREEAATGNIPWTMRGTLGMFGTRH
jgi:hypothetical protein